MALRRPILIPVAAATAILIADAGMAFACCNNYAEFAAYCRAQGGVPSVGAVCSEAPSSGSASGGSGLSANQQLMMGLATSLAAGFVQALQEEQAARARVRAAEMAAAAAEVAAYQAAERARADERHRRLMSNLKDLAETRLVPKREEGTETLRLKVGDDYFGGTERTVVLKRNDAVVAAAPLIPEAASEPIGVSAVDQSPIGRIFAAYHQAADNHAKAELKHQQLEEEKTLAARIREEAQKKHDEQKAQAATIPVDQSEAKKAEDDKLAEAERLLQQAIAFDDKATQDLSAAKADVARTKADLDLADQKRVTAERDLAQAAPGPSN